MREKGITVVTRIKNDLLERIRRSCNIKKKIDKPEKIDKYQKHLIIGTCNHLYFKNYPCEQIK